MKSFFVLNKLINTTLSSLNYQMSNRLSIILQGMNSKIVCILLAILALSNCYSSSLAYDLAHLESISYLTQAEINSWVCAQCANYPVKNQQSFFSSVANIQGFALYYPKINSIIVAFRGSVDFTNWLYNLDTFTTSYPSCSGCNVHVGFYNAYKGVAPLVRNVVQKLLGLYRDAKLVITGHSLGGAMGVLCALDLKDIHGRVDELYTFGQPRVGNQNFANYLQSQITSYKRIVHYADTVVHVPQSILGFKHGGVQIWYTPRGMTTFKQCNQSEDKACSNQIGLTSMSTSDHSLENYYMKLPVINMNIRRKQIITRESILAESYTNQEIELAQDRKVKQIMELLRDQA